MAKLFSFNDQRIPYTHKIMNCDYFCNKWHEKNPQYKYKVLAFTGDNKNGKSLLIKYWKPTK